MFCMCLHVKKHTNGPLSLVLTCSIQRWFYCIPEFVLYLTRFIYLQGFILIISELALTYQTTSNFFLNKVLFSTYSE